MAAKVIFIGLDAVDALLVRQYTAEGFMPSFAELERRGVSRMAANCLDTLPGAIWPEISTGIVGGRLGEFYHPAQLIAGESRIRKLTADDLQTESYFWTRAGRAGKRVAVIDIPQTAGAEDFDGLAVFEWGLHDRQFNPSSIPPELLENLRSRHGDHPIQDHACDLLADAQGYDSLLDLLLDGCGRKTDLILDIMAREDWDLLSCCFGEGHCAGHQFYGLQDPNSPIYDEDAPQVRKNALRTVYQKIDEGVGRIMDAAGGDAHLIVLATHGMGPYVGGPQLLREVLARLGMCGRSDTRLRRKLRRAHDKARQLPFGAKRLLGGLMELAPVRSVQRTIGASLDPFESRQTIAAPVRNNRCGAIRLNLEGRDPYGRIKKGREEQEVLRRIISELQDLRDPKSGETIVEQVLVSSEVFDAAVHPNVPDLIVRFRTDIGRIEECMSPSVGHIHEPINSPGYPRSGDHRPVSRIWHIGPGVSRREEAESANVLDIAPTILALLGVPVPAELDGQVLDSAKSPARNGMTVA